MSVGPATHASLYAQHGGDDGCGHRSHRLLLLRADLQIRTQDQEKCECVQGQMPVQGQVQGPGFMGGRKTQMRIQGKDE